MAENTYVVGVDIGGTNIRIGLVDYKYNVTNFVLESSNQIIDDDMNEESKKLIKFIKKYIDNQNKNIKIIALSIGFPSTIDRERKKILSTPNIKGFENLEIVSEIELNLGIKTFINKDVNMLILFDMFEEKILDRGITAGFYLGTGLGNAICIDGKFLLGKNGAAAEIGHIPSRNNYEICGCGNIGCVETFASGKNLKKICKNELKNVFIGDVFKLYKDNPLIKDFIRGVAIPIATEINILDPDYIILGGGVIHMDEFPKKLLEKNIREYTRKPYPESNLEFKYSKKGQKNGVIGAGIYAYREMDN